MLLNKHEKRQKKAIALQRERDRLNDIQSKLGLEKLDKPIHHGYKKFFVLRDDAQRREDASVLRKILQYVNSSIFSKDKEFKSRRWFNDFRRSEVINGVAYPKLQHLNEPKHKELLLAEPRASKWFHCCTSEVDGVHKCWSCCTRGKHYEFNAPWYFVTEVAPNFITHVTKPDGDIESSLSKIKNTMRTGCMEELLDHMKGRRVRYHRDPYNGLCSRGAVKTLVEEEIQTQIHESELEPLDHSFE